MGLKGGRKEEGRGGEKVQGMRKKLIKKVEKIKKDHYEKNSSNPDRNFK